MGDTIFAMRSCAVAALLVACSSDPVLHVTVTHPTGLDVASTTVSVYESKKLSCQDIEYGDVDASTLQGALVASETVDAQGTTGALSGLSRTDPKLVVARGYDGTGALVAAGCAEQDVVSGDATLAIATEATAIVSYALLDPTGTNDIYGIATTVTDVSGKELDGRQVWWRVYGPAGTAPASATGVTTISDGVWQPTQPVCTTKGLASIHPVPPGLIGGFAIELRVAWSVDPPQLFSSFTKIDPTLTALAPPTGATKFCTRHVAASPTLACLDNPTGTQLVAFDFSVGESAGTTTLSPKASTPVQSVPADTIALYGVDNGARRDVFAATQHCAVAGVFGSTPKDTTMACPLVTADDILYVPACGASPAKLLFHISAGMDKIRSVDPLGGSQVDIDPGYRGLETQAKFNSAGCVTQLDPAGGTSTSKQVIVLDFAKTDGTNPSTRALYDCTTSCQSLDLPLPQAAAGFTGGSESRIVVTTVDATGVVLSQDVLLPDPGGAADHLVERSRQPAASIPISLAIGNFDADNGVDLLWDIVTRRGTSFQIAYARTVDAQPLSALSPPVGLLVDTIEVGDLTGDGHDDIAIVGQTLSTTMPAHGVAVIPTQVPPVAVTLVSDSKTCAP